MTSSPARAVDPAAIEPAEPTPAPTADPQTPGGPVAPVESRPVTTETTVIPPDLRLAPTARVIRRSPREIQIERGDRAVIVANLPEDVITRLTSAPGEPVRGGAPAGPAGLNTDSPIPDVAVDAVDAVDIARVLRTLTSAGFLSTSAAQDARRADPGARAVALGPDLAALGDRFGARAPAVLHGRRDRQVRVHGTGRLAPLIAALLVAAGVGRVDVPDGTEVALRDALPGGLLPADEGRRTVLAAADAVRRAKPGTELPQTSVHGVDLVIATEGLPVVPHLRAALLAAQSPYLVAGVWGSSAVIGPLVVPGHTSCLHCADLHRADRDPSWPVLQAQLGRPGAGSTPSEVAVCALAAAVTVLQALAFLDGERPATADGTLELRLPDWRLRRRHWTRHTGCPCAA